MSEEEFILLLDQVQASLYRMALAVMSSEADANDALQEASLRAFLARSQLRGGADGFRPWMKRILLHVCSDMLRARRRIVPVGGPDELCDDRREPELPVEHEVWDHVANLPQALREVVALRYLFDLSQEQVAQHLAIPVGTVKSRLNRALRLLRQRYIPGKDGEERAVL